MRHFVGAACVAVIAAVAYFFWGEYQEHGARADREAARTWARNQLFHYAQAEPGDVEKVRGFCTSVAASEALKGDGNAELWLATCRLDGYL